MTGKEVLKNALESTQQILHWFIADLSDADFMERPVANANHIAWQIGHTTAVEARFLPQIGGVAPPLPDGFDKKHTKDTASLNNAADFYTKQQYIDCFDKVRNASIARLEKLSDLDLDTKTEGPMAQFAPNWGAMFILLANHTMMHVGQFSAIRRKIGKPVLF